MNPVSINAYLAAHNNLKPASTTTNNARVHAQSFVKPSKPPVHRASLVDPESHSPALIELVNARISTHLVQHIVDSVAESLGFSMNPSLSLRDIAERQVTLSNFRPFVQKLLVHSKVTTPIILSSLVYIERAKCRLLRFLTYDELDIRKIFLVAMVIASKYLNDLTINNLMWEECNSIFGARQIASFELTFLGCLRWKLRLSDADIMEHSDIIEHHDNSFSEDAAAMNNLQYFRCSIRRKPQIETFSPDGRDRCPELDSPSSFSSGDVSLPQTPSSSKNVSPSSKSKSPFRKWLCSLRNSSRHSTEISASQ
ncbi:hypothetical protein F5050DRAFT_1764341 [Lentinula boryana]|uniref:Cyclin N-terminal domain-containing protein n=1 Tax=Lentinula boryana TaxID=40481 RepID=A0ABQ8QBB7_9AGAR|nr:hypothetical protein F5050DRAFT_1764341 [Lentinula boryana]